MLVQGHDIPDAFLHNLNDGTHDLVVQPTSLAARKLLATWPQDDEELIWFRGPDAEPAGAIDTMFAQIDAAGLYLKP